VERKVVSQISHLKNLGVLIDLVPVDSNLENYFPPYKFEALILGNLYARIKRALYIRSIFAKTVSSLGYDDIVYCRGHIYP